MSGVAMVPQTAEEVRRAVGEIKNHLNNASAEIDKARQKLLVIYETKSWRELGYENFRAFAEGEFTVTWQQVYRLVGAARIDANIRLFSPGGQPVAVKDTHARELKKLATPEQQYQAYTAAQRLATAEGKDEPEISHIRTGIQQAQAQTVVDKHPLVAHLVAAGDVTVTTGRELVTALEPLKPDVQRAVMALMGKHGLCNPALIEPIGALYARKLRGDYSKVLEVIEATGCVAGTPLKRAVYTDFHRAQEEAQAEHIAEGVDRQRQKALEAGQILPEAVVLTVWKGDMKKTVAALRKALGDSQFERLRDAMLRE